MVRVLNELEARLLPARPARVSRSFPRRPAGLGSSSEGELRKVAVGGGARGAASAVSTVAPRGASWGDDGFIVLATTLEHGL